MKSTLPKLRKITYRPEEELQLTVVEWLTLELAPPAVFWATPNQRGTRKGWEQKLLNAMGVKAGVPDIFVFHAGLLLGIELKRPPALLKSGKTSRAKPVVSDAQDAFHASLEANGGHVAVCRSLEDVKSFLMVWSVPRRWRVR